MAKFPQRRMNKYQQYKIRNTGNPPKLRKRQVFRFRAFQPPLENNKRQFK